MPMGSLVDPATVLTTTPWTDATWVNYTASSAPATSYSASGLVGGGGGRQQ